MLEFHPLANLFPLIEGAEFDELVADIKAHGLADNIVVWQGKVLDGRNRYRACVAAEVDPRLTQFWPELQGDPLAFVLSKNLRRRHLNESQRAMVAAKIETLTHGGDRRSEDQDANLHLEISRPKAAEMLSVSKRSIASAKAVHEKGDPDLVRAVEQGKLAVSEAAKAATLAPDQQQQVVKLATEGKANVVRTVIKQGVRDAHEAKLAQRQSQGNLALPIKRYGVILADPEWKFEVRSKATGLDRAPENYYSTSATEVIAARAVNDIAAKDCVLFLWATQAMLPAALLVMGAWGFAYKSQFIWRKVFPGQQTGIGFWNRSVHEILLVGTCGDVPAPAPGTQYPSVIDAPVRGHSVKPDWQYELIESYFPNLPKIELNARRARAGWDSWGAEAPEGGESRERPTPIEPSGANAGSKPEAPPMDQDAIGNSGAHPLDIPDFLIRRRPEAVDGR
jgi:N6-adenosine-specific RNA methylase IME4